jgi:hypothetical protein
MVPACVAEYFRARDHALPEFFRERCQCFFVYPQRAKPLPRKGNRDPSLLSFNRIPGLLNGSDLVENSRKPGPSLSRLAKRKELIPTRERRHTGYDDVLEIVELKHDVSPRFLRQGFCLPHKGGICHYRAKTNSKREAVEITTFHVIVTHTWGWITVGRYRAYS